MDTLQGVYQDTKALLAPLLDKHGVQVRKGLSEAKAVWVLLPRLCLRVVAPMPVHVVMLSYPLQKLDRHTFTVTTTHSTTSTRRRQTARTSSTVLAVGASSTILLLWTDQTRFFSRLPMVRGDVGWAALVDRALNNESLVPTRSFL